MGEKKWAYQSVWTIVAAEATQIMLDFLGVPSAAGTDLLLAAKQGLSSIDSFSVAAVQTQFFFPH